MFTSLFGNLYLFVCFCVWIFVLFVLFSFVLFSFCFVLFSFSFCFTEVVPTQQHNSLSYHPLFHTYYIVCTSRNVVMYRNSFFILTCNRDFGNSYALNIPINITINILLKAFIAYIMCIVKIIVNCMYCCSNVQ